MTLAARRHAPRDSHKLLPSSIADMAPGRSSCSWRPVALCLLLPAILLTVHLYSRGSLPLLGGGGSGRQEPELNLTEAMASTDIAAMLEPPMRQAAAAAGQAAGRNATAADGSEGDRQPRSNPAASDKANTLGEEGKMEQQDGADEDTQAEGAAEAVSPEKEAAVNQQPSFPAAPTTGKSWWLELTAGLTPESFNGKYSEKITSQFGQDGILAYIFDHVGTTNKFYVEFGFDAGSWELSVQGGSGPNTANLYNNGWSGLLMDGGHDNQTMNLRQEMIFEHNILDLFDKYGVPREPDYVSVDIDSYDLWVFRKILTSGKYRPRVLTAEYNCNCPLGGTFSFPNDPLERWDAWREGFDTAGRFMGACLGAFTMVAQEAGYSLVYVEKPVDAFFVRNDLLQGPVPPYETFQYAVNPHCELHHPSSHEYIGRWVDYKTLSNTGNLQAAKDAALQQMKDLHVFGDFFVNVTED